MDSEANCKYVALFSTNGGERQPRSATASDFEVVARSDPAADAQQIISELRAKWPHVCNNIFAPWDISWFFDEHDFFQQGGRFLYEDVLGRMQKENEKFLIFLCQEWTECNKSHFRAPTYVPVEQLFHQRDLDRYGRDFLERAKRHMCEVMDKTALIESQKAAQIPPSYRTDAGKRTDHPQRSGIKGQAHNLASSEQQSAALPSSAQIQANNAWPNHQLTAQPAIPSFIPSHQNMHHGQYSHLSYLSNHGRVDPQAPYMIVPSTGHANLPFPGVPILQPPSADAHLLPGSIPVPGYLISNQIDVPMIGGIPGHPNILPNPMQAHPTMPGNNGLPATAITSAPMMQHAGGDFAARRRHSNSFNNRGRGRAGNPGTRRSSGSFGNQSDELGQPFPSPGFPPNRKRKGSGPAPGRGPGRRNTLEGQALLGSNLPIPYEHHESPELVQSPVSFGQDGTQSHAPPSQPAQAAKPTRAPHIKNHQPIQQGPTKTNEALYNKEQEQHSEGVPPELQVGPRYIGSQVNDICELFVKRAGHCTADTVRQKYEPIAPVKDVRIRQGSPHNTNPRGFPYVSVVFYSCDAVRQVLRATETWVEFFPELPKHAWNPRISPPWYSPPWHPQSQSPSRGKTAVKEPLAQLNDKVESATPVNDSYSIRNKVFSPQDARSSLDMTEVMPEKPQPKQKTWADVASQPKVVPGKTVQEQHSEQDHKSDADQNSPESSKLETLPIGQTSGVEVSARLIESATPHVKQTKEEIPKNDGVDQHPLPIGGEQEKPTDLDPSPIPEATAHAETPIEQSPQIAKINQQSHESSPITHIDDQEDAETANTEAQKKETSPEPKEDARLQIESAAFASKSSKDITGASSNTEVAHQFVEETAQSSVHGVAAKLPDTAVTDASQGAVSSPPSPARPQKTGGRRNKNKNKKKTSRDKSATTLTEPPKEEIGVSNHSRNVSNDLNRQENTRDRRKSHLDKTNTKHEVPETVASSTPVPKQSVATALPNYQHSREVSFQAPEIGSACLESKNDGSLPSHAVPAEHIDQDKCTSRFRTSEKESFTTTKAATADVETSTVEPAASPDHPPKTLVDECSSDARETANVHHEQSTRDSTTEPRIEESAEPATDASEDMHQRGEVISTQSGEIQQQAADADPKSAIKTTVVSLPSKPARRAVSASAVLSAPELRNWRPEFDESCRLLGGLMTLLPYDASKWKKEADDLKDQLDKAEAQLEEADDRLAASTGKTVKGKLKKKRRAAIEAHGQHYDELVMLLGRLRSEAEKPREERKFVSYSLTGQNLPKQEIFGSHDRAFRRPLGSSQTMRANRPEFARPYGDRFSTFDIDGILKSRAARDCDTEASAKMRKLDRERRQSGSKGTRGSIGYDADSDEEDYHHYEGKLMDWHNAKMDAMENETAEARTSLENKSPADSDTLNTDNSHGLNGTGEQQSEQPLSEVQNDGASSVYPNEVPGNNKRLFKQRRDSSDHTLPFGYNSNEGSPKDDDGMSDKGKPKSIAPSVNAEEDSEIAPEATSASTIKSNTAPPSPDIAPSDKVEATSHETQEENVEERAPENLEAKDRAANESTGSESPPLRGGCVGMPEEWPDRAHLPFHSILSPQVLIEDTAIGEEVSYGSKIPRSAAVAEPSQIAELSNVGDSNASKLENRRPASAAPPVIARGRTWASVAASSSAALSPGVPVMRRRESDVSSLGNLGLDSERKPSHSVDTSKNLKRGRSTSRRQVEDDEWAVPADGVWKTSMGDPRKKA